MQNNILLPTLVILGALFFISPIEDWFTPTTECESPLEFFMYQRNSGIETCEDSGLMDILYPPQTLASPQD